MGKKNVLTYNEESNRLEIPQTGDDYQMVRDLHLTEGVNAIMHGGGYLHLKDSVKLIIADSASLGRVPVCATSGGQLAWSPFINILDGSIICDSSGSVGIGWGNSQGLNMTTDGGARGIARWDYQYQQFDAVVQLDVNPQLGNYNYTLPFSFQLPYQSKSITADSVSVANWSNVSEMANGYAAQSSDLYPQDFDIMPFTGRLMGLFLGCDRDNFEDVGVRLEIGRRMDTTFIEDTGNDLYWKFLDSITLSPSDCGGRIAQDKYATSTVFGDTASGSNVVYSYWYDSLRKNAVHAGDSIRFSLQFNTNCATTGGPSLYIKTNWGKHSYYAIEDSAMAINGGLYDEARYLGYNYLYNDSVSNMGGWTIDTVGTPG